MAKTSTPIPPGYHTLTPYMVIKNAAEAIKFYVKAFGAEERGAMTTPDGKIMHGEIKIGDSVIMLVDEMPSMKALGPQSLGGCTMSLMFYTADVDAVFKKAVDAGCTVKMPLADQFWGDRYGKLVDPFGHEWAIATHIEDFTPEEMSRRAADAMKQMAGATN